MNLTNIHLNELKYFPPVRIIKYRFRSYLLYNALTSAYLVYDTSKGIFFCDDKGNHYFFISGQDYEIKTDCEDIKLKWGKHIFVESLEKHFYSCYTWSDVYKKAVEYFTHFAQ